MSFASLQQARAKRAAQSSFVHPAINSDAPSSDNNKDVEEVTLPPDAPQAPTSTSSSVKTNPSTSSKGTLYSQLPPFLEIRTTAASGRGIWAKKVEDGGVKGIPAGTRLFAVEPHAHALSTIHLPTLCSACHRSSGPLVEGEAQPLKRCTKCRVMHYCSQKCQTHDWPVHKLECEALQRWILIAMNRDGPTMEGVKIPGEAVRALARLFWVRARKGTETVWTQEIEAMQSHRESLPPSSHEALTLLSHSLARYISGSDRPSPDALSKFGINSARDLLDLISKFTVNSFTLTNPSLTSVGVAISPLAALINHSCEPNAVVVFPRSSVAPSPGSDPLEVVAIKDIPPGEEILTSYVDISLPRHLRLKELKERYMFTCVCSACSNVEDGHVDPREAMKCERPGCTGLIPLPAPDVKPKTKPVCSKCAQEPITSQEEVPEAIQLGGEALERATNLELEDPAAAYKYTSNMIPLLSRLIPITAHPLLALCRLHLSLLVSRLSNTVHELGGSLVDASSDGSDSDPRLSKDEVDEVCAAAARSVAAVSAVFPEGHPVRGVALAELGKLLCVDVDQDARAVEQIVSPAVAASDPSRILATAVEDGVSSFPAGEERLKLARGVLLRARAELRRGFGGEGGEVARQVEESIRNIELEWKGWRKVVSQGGMEVHS